MKTRFPGLIVCFLVVSLSSASYRQVVQQGNTNTSSSGSSTTTVRGQIMLPDGNLPSLPVRFEIDGANGMHDIRFTDSNGRIILERLQSNISYTIFVQSDELNWGDTRFTFIPSENQDARFYLKPLSAVRLIKPSEYKPSPAVAALHDKAIKAFQDSKPQEAEALMRQAMKADPKYIAAFNDLGVMLMRQQKFTDAEQVFRDGLQSNPKSVALLENLGTDLVHAGKYQEAIAPLKDELHLQPARGQAHLQLGAALVETGRYAEAEGELFAAKLDSVVDQAGLELYFGKLYAGTGNFIKSIEAFTAYLKLAPANSPSIPIIRAAITRMQDEINKRASH